MKTMLSKLRSAAARFSRSQDGSSTVEIVLILPAFMSLFLMAFEGGRISSNHMMLERGVSMATRDIKIGALLDPTHADIKERICLYATTINDCINQLQVEMVPMDVRDWTAALDGPTQCIDRDEDVQPAVQFTNGGNNQLMVLRVCSLFDPIMPTTGLGKSIPKKSGGGYALVATSAFVMEPFQ